MVIGYLSGYAGPLTANALSNKRSELKRVQSKISKSAKNLDQLHAQQELVQQQLAEIDKKYARLVLSLKELQQHVEQKQQNLKLTRLAITKQQKRINAHKRGIAEQVRAAHRLGQHDRIKLLLNQEDFALSSRVLAYYNYLNKMRSQKVARISQEVKELGKLELRQQHDKLTLTKLLKQKQTDQALLLETKQSRTILLSQLNKKYHSDEEELRRLQQDERRLIALLDMLRQAEQRRVEEDARRAKAEMDKKLLMDAKKSRNNQQSVKHRTDDKEKVDNNSVIGARKESDRGAGAVHRPDKTSASQSNIDKHRVVKPQDFIKPEITGKPFAQLRGKLPWPVRGRLLKTFGSSRLESHWDGVLIGADAGQNVRAVANGRVVYAAWLRSYGLLIIVNHGGGYMTVYAFNESLYKRVGANVKAGEVIASVGQSGGQSESALYFEIRRQGKPLNPSLWCKN